MSAGFNPEWFVNRLKQFQSFKEMLTRERPETFMLVEVPEPMGKTWLLRRMELHCQKSSPQIPAVYIGFHDPRINKVDDLGVMLLLRDKLIELNGSQAFERLNREIGRYVGDPGRVFIRPMQLLADEMLTVFLNQDDLRILARFLSVNYDQLGGEQMREKAFQLINFCREHGSLPQLLEELIRERDFKADDWTRLINDILQAADSDDAGAGAAEFDAVLKATGSERERILSAITKAFIACLYDYLGGLSRLVLLIDTYDQCPRDAQSWLEDYFLPYLSDEALIEGLILVVAGKDTFYVGEESIINLIVRDEEHPQNPLKHGLLPFTSDFIAEYSRKRQVNEEWATPANLEMFSDGYPKEMAWLYDSKRRRR